ncbi:MAG: gamma carbonic anhydrase family protein [Thermoplasmatales archaeon]|nr:MAG: gamma carbonic anhydrase family protein [Thermoplasmatales archaeon]
MPQIHETTFVAKSAIVIGNVIIGKNCGIYPQAVIRGDLNSIEIGDGSNIQDCSVIHTDEDYCVKIGKNDSIGHAAVIHGAIIGDDCLIGIHATVLNGAKIGSGSIIGANALVTANMKVPKKSMVMGVPGKIVKQDESFPNLARKNAEEYKKLSLKHRQGKFLFYKSD